MEVTPGRERNSVGWRSQDGFHGWNLTEGDGAKQAGPPAFSGFRKPRIRDVTEAGLELAVSRDSGP